MARGKRKNNTSTNENNVKDITNANSKDSSEKNNEGILIEYTYGIIDKQFFSYSFNYQKIQGIIAIDSALIAGIFVGIQAFKINDIAMYILFAISLLLLLISLLLCLFHSIPEIDSRIGNDDNLRTLIGIKKYNKKEYYEKISVLNSKDLLRMNCYQISGLCKLNIKSQKLIRIGVILTSIGVFVASIALIMLLLSKISGII